MSTENENTPVPPAPSTPPVPVDPPAATAPGGAPSTAAAQRPDAGATARLPAYPPPHGAIQDPPRYGPSHAGVDQEHAQAASGTTGGWPPADPPGQGDDGGSGTWGASYQPPAPRPGGRRTGLVAAVVVAALVAGGVGGGVGYWASEREDATDSTTVSDSGGGIKRSPTSVAGIAARSLPSVVTIEAQSGSGEGGTGTGFVYDKQGHILTNNHVVDTAAEGGQLSATFSDGKKHAAEVVGRAKGYDVAVIKLKDAPSNLKPLPLGDSEKVAVGDPAIAIGAPFGLSNTVTTGIVSAKKRPVTTSESGSSDDASYMSALQTDASINPGNSGGPLLDARGAVIGINSAIKPSNEGGGLTGGQGGSIGLGFAIPINQAKNVAKQLIKTGQPVYPVIGATVSLEEQGDGARITDRGAAGSPPVTPNGPADKAGLRPGDVITKLDGTIIDSGPTLIGEIWSHQPGDTVTITYQRGGEEHTVKLVLGERKGDNS